MMAYVKRLDFTWWLEQKKRVLKRDRYQCCDCKESGDLYVHHIVWVSEGGSDGLENLESLCWECHYKRHPNSWNYLVVAIERRALGRRRRALAALYERFISALYGQGQFPCDLIEGVLSVDCGSVVEAVVVSPDPECSRWHVEIEAEIESGIECVSQPMGSVVTHNLSPEEVAKAF